ncbi:MAG: D-alanyl-D-alanine carboxypeptidase [Bacilli bacterium]|nr:D-alanyl-D-alanine carboxypeptidase [Bacilli bacterium]
MLKKMLFFMIMLFVLYILPVKAEEDLVPNSKSAILIETSTGKVLYEKNPDEKLPPASMTKVMSMLLIMEAIDEGRLNLTDEVEISPTAASMGGSQVFLQAGERYPVEELLKGIAIASGNDAVVALAEKVAGSVEKFVEMMNEKAQKLGLSNTHFDNPHGLDSENHYTTAKDMSIMSQELVKHKKILEFTSIYEYYMPKPDGSTTWLVNTNKLVRFYEGVDGLKTGFTSTAKYCLTATAKKGNMRLITVVMGVESSDLRSSDTVKLLNYGFNSFELQTILKADKPLGKVKVINGKKEQIAVYLKEDATHLLNKTNVNPNEKYYYTLKINELKAPLKKGDVVGKAQIKNSFNEVIKEVDIIILENVQKANIFDYFKKNLKLITSGL